LDPGGQLVVGEAALALDLRMQIRSIKAAVTAGRDSVMVDGQSLDARMVMKALLSEAIGRAERAMPNLRNTSKIFLGCPALWDGTQRRLLADVVHELGIDVDVADIIDEPVAAGLHSLLSRVLKGGVAPSGKTVVFDAGGGTLDVAYLDVARDKVDDFTVLSAEGIAVSGDALDESIAEHLAPRISDIEDRQKAALLLVARSRELKEGLTRDKSRTVALGGGFDVQLQLNRTQLEELFEPQLAKSVSLTQSAVRGSLLREHQTPSPDAIRRHDWKDLARPIRHVVLVGGLSQMPVIRSRLAEVFPEATVTLADSPQESVALGLAMGGRLNRLNLPRPPVSFVVEFGPPELIKQHKLEQWAQTHRYVYNAFSPLYFWEQVIRGETRLGYSRELPFPDGVSSELEITIRGESPDRSREPLELRIKQTNTTELLDSGVARGVTTGHSWNRKARFTLYTNGDLVINGSKGEIFKFRVQRWPILRGKGHDYSREIMLEHVSTEPWGSKLRYDDWRFN